jgi:hypothetical protein
MASLSEIRVVTSVMSMSRATVTTEASSEICGETTNDSSCATATEKRRNLSLTISIEHGISATALTRLDSIPDPINSDIGTVDMELLNLVFDMVNVNASSAMVRSDHASMHKGNILSAW